MMEIQEGEWFIRVNESDPTKRGVGFWGQTAMVVL
jgi:hypothetical protein